MEIANFRGELAALAAAMVWACSSIAYTLFGQKLAPLVLNFTKGIIAIALIILTLLISRTELPLLDVLAGSLLLLSGVLGIGLGDTAYFAALNKLGARRTLLIETLAPPIAALFALIFLAEQLTSLAWCGIFLTMLGVAVVITEKTANYNPRVSRRQIKGLVWAILAAIAQASGAVLSRYALVMSEITPLWSTLLRLVGGTIIVALLWLFGRLKRPTPTLNQTAWTGKLIGAIALTSFASTYLGIWLQQTAFKFSPAGIAQTLLATSPLFVLPMTAAMGEKITFRSLLGVLIAIAGIALLFGTR